VILFAEDLAEFLKGFDESLRVLEKAVREKRREGPPRGDKRREVPPEGKGGNPPGRSKKQRDGEGPEKRPPRLVVKSRKKRED
jgi:hypothetical protein